MILLWHLFNWKLFIQLDLFDEGFLQYVLHQLSFKFFKFYKLKVRDSNLIPKQHGYKKVKNQITRRRSKQRMKNFSSNKVKFLCSFLILFTISERSSQTVIYTCFRFIVISFVYYTPFKKTLRLTRDLS